MKPKPISNKKKQLTKKEEKLLERMYKRKNSPWIITREEVNKFRNWGSSYDR